MVGEDSGAATGGAGAGIGGLGGVAGGAAGRAPGGFKAEGGRSGAGGTGAAVPGNPTAAGTELVVGGTGGFRGPGGTGEEETPPTGMGTGLGGSLRGGSFTGPEAASRELDGGTLSFTL